MFTAPLNDSASKTADAARHPWARSASPLMSADRWRPTIIENVGGCAHRITVRWDLRTVRRTAHACS